MAELITLLSNSIVSAVLLGYLVVLWLALVVWAALDIFSRTKNWLVRIASILLVGIGSIFGFIIYLVIRPQSTLEDQNLHRLEEKILASQSRVFSCQSCGEYLREDFLFCTNCAAAVKKECPNCKRVLETSWSQCPFCGVFAGPAILPQAQEALSSSNLEASKVSIFSIIKKLLSSPKEPVEIKRGRGRPRKHPLPTLPVVKRPRGRPRKNATI